MNKIRIYHATLAVLCVAAYASGDFGLVHNWIGYGVALVLLFRLLWAFSGAAQLGLMRFYPSFEGISTENWVRHPAVSRSLLACILLSAIVATGTGIAMDRGQTFKTTQTEVRQITPGEKERDEKFKKEEENEGALEEIHELFANLMLVFVAMHVTYLMAFKRPLAKFMLFVPIWTDKDN